ncbi:MAG: response regulator [bacterium]|nr:response regulator [bacterium]
MRKTLIIFWIFSSLFTTSNLIAQNTQPVAKDGVLDLSQWNFDNGDVLLNGEWEFYWQELLSVQERSANRKIIQFPQLWNDMDLEGVNIDSRGYATYRLRLILPPNRPSLAVELPDYYSAYELFIDNRLFANNGRVAVSEEEYIPKFLPMTRAFIARADTVTLTLHVANFDHSKGGTKLPITLGKSNALFSKRVTNFSLDIFLTGSLMMGGLFFLGLFLFGNQSKPLLYFALFCISYGYRVIGSDLYSLHSLFPDIPWQYTLRLEYLTLHLSGFLFLKYQSELYPEDLPKWFDKVFSILFVTLSASILLPAYYFTQTVEPFFVLLIAGIPVVIYAQIRSVIMNRIAALYIVLSTLVILFVFIYSFLDYFGVLDGSVYVTFTCYIIFFFLQSLILSFRFSFRLKTAKEAAEQAAVAKTEFLSTMSHEIRTPLNAVVGLTNYLIEEEPRDDQKDSLDTLKFASENLLALINDILDYNKIDAGKIQFEEKPINIRELLSGMVSAYKKVAGDKGVDFYYNSDDNIPKFISGDATRLNQVLTNLVGNAIKFTKEGHVKITIDLIARVENRVAIKFTVEDTGIGIPENKIGQIFQSFTQASSSTTREFGGSGLGLTITDKLLKLQGVSLNVTSEVGVGSKFFFTQYFPVYVQEEEEALIASTKPKDLAGHKILLVEDNPVNVMVAMKFLTKWKLNVDSVENGREAMKMVHENKYDVILMDLQMPIMDGYNATKAMRNRGIETPIIALTAAALQDVTEKVFEAGMNDYITKPFNPDILYQKLEKYIQ